MVLTIMWRHAVFQLDKTLFRSLKLFSDSTMCLACSSITSKHLHSSSMQIVCSSKKKKKATCSQCGRCAALR